MMDRMVTARYAPLVLPHHLNGLLGGDYQKYLPRLMDRVKLQLKSTGKPFSVMLITKILKLRMYG